MTKPHMTLPNGDIIHDGEYGITSGGLKVGPMYDAFGSIWDCKKMFPNSGDFHWFMNGDKGSFASTECSAIIAKWHPVEVESNLMKPNYNDGEWHEWHGGECPVHLKSAVHVALRSGTISKMSTTAGSWYWGHNDAGGEITSFRVITPYIEQPSEYAKPAKRNLRTLGGRIEMTKSHMKLPNGDIIYEGEYGITSDGEKVGPMRNVFRSTWDCREIFPNNGEFNWFVDGVRGATTSTECSAIVAKWHPVKFAKRNLRTIDEPFGDLNERTQERFRKAAKRGWPVEWFNGVNWEPCDPAFGALTRYRLDPTFTPPAKRRTIYVINGMTFETARAAKTAYPGCKPVKFKECKK